MSESKQRLDWVDTAKGISILLVVMMHSAIGVGEVTSQVSYLHWIIAWASPFRMPEFFLISGLFLSQVIDRDWRRYADRRVVHYLYFYALWALIHLLFKEAVGAGHPVTAMTHMLWAIVEPYGVLWFIYMLAAFSAVAKLLHNARAPHWLVLIGAALLQLVHVQTGWYLLDQFAEHFIYFYSGYVFAPVVFRLVAWAQDHVVQTLAGLSLWALLETLLVFSPGYRVLPMTIHMGLSTAPGIHLALALAGSVALCVVAGLVSKLAFMDWLRWLGAQSIVVYLAFALPMAATRILLVRVGFTNADLISTLVMSSAVLTPLVLFWLIQRTGRGRWLFERPAWARLPGTPGARIGTTTVRTPAE
ncbi:MULTISPECIES: acyltransferase family protein [unclassified Devosia]|uniref:acyltransferase family protein n=1 Tax=unclassified Devosia TaxID=196773 RepID=UPI001555F91B|nr:MULTISPECIES: acyltransferase family protein [unclassified Devosia]